MALTKVEAVESNKVYALQKESWMYKPAIGLQAESNTNVNFQAFVYKIQFTNKRFTYIFLVMLIEQKVYYLEWLHMLLLRTHEL